jgi:DNA invertase Pin-like site-specific DNA recombinase
LAICFRSSPFRAAARLSCWRENINICVVSVNVGFVSLSEALDLTTPSGRALAGMLAIFAEFEHDILRDRVKAGIAQARKEGRPHGRPPSVTKYIPKVRALAKKGLSKSEISRPLRISRTSVRRFLARPVPSRRDELLRV